MLDIGFFLYTVRFRIYKADIYSFKYDLLNKHDTLPETKSKIIALENWCP